MWRQNLSKKVFRVNCPTNISSSSENLVNYDKVSLVRKLIRNCVFSCVFKFWTVGRATNKTYEDLISQPGEVVIDRFEK